MIWYEMSYYHTTLEQQERQCDRLAKENNSCRSANEWLDLSYREFVEDDYSDGNIERW
jgi:hypothetical protein